MVYVDPIQPCLPNRLWRWRESCHLVADTESELHAFAARLGLRRDWFQHHAFGLAHYDLTRMMRVKAVRLGAQEIEDERMVRRIRVARTPGVRHCRLCFCTEDNACHGDFGVPCHWVSPDLCSACASQAAIMETRR
jgi:hypothetical protein